MLLKLKAVPNITIISAHAPHNGYPSQDRQKFFNDLADTIHQIPAHDMILIGGDLNAEIGNEKLRKDSQIRGPFTYKSTPTKKGSNGWLLLELCEKSGMRIIQSFFQTPAKHLWTHKRPKGDLVQLDHILVNGKWIKSIKKCRAYNSVPINSDHRILTATVSITLKSYSNLRSTPKTDWKALGIPDIKQNFDQTFKTAYNPIGDNIQEDYDNFLKATQVATNLLPKVLPQKKRKVISKLSDEIRKKRNTVQAQIKKNSNSTNKAELKQLNEKLRQQYKQDVMIELQKHCEDLTKADRMGDIRKTWQIVHKISGKKDNRKLIGCMKFPDGTPMEEKQVTSEWAKYFAGILGGSPHIIQPEDLPPPASTDLPIPITPFTQEEIETVVHAAKSHKAPGLDELSIDFLKNGDKHIQLCLLDITNQVFEQKTPPCQWKKSVINPIPKIGSASFMSNHRGISLMSVAAKLYNKMLLNRIQPQIDPILRDNQCGFRRDRSCVDQIHILRRIIEGAEALCLPLVATYIDFKKAFDSINRQMMFAILRHYGIPQQIVDAIKCVYDDSQSCVRNNGELSEFFEVMKGVFQGGTLAPYLFDITLDYPMKKAEKNYGFITHHRLSSRKPEVKLPDLDFADDVALLDDSLDQAQKHLESVADECKKIGLEINLKKTKYSTYNINSEKHLHLDSIPIEKTDNFKYLGAMTRSSTDDINRRRALAFSTFHKMNNIWNNNDIPLDLKVKIFKVSVLTIFLYGCETWIITEMDADCINSLATICYRKILHIDQVIEHVTNQEVLRRVKTQELIFHVQKRQLEKTGHRLRKPEGSFANRYAIYEPSHGHRTPGRPRKTYRDQIATIINANNKPSETEIREYAQDRANWKKIIKDRTGI